MFWVITDSRHFVTLQYCPNGQACIVQRLFMVVISFTGMLILLKYDMVLPGIGG